MTCMFIIYMCSQYSIENILCVLTNRHSVILRILSMINAEMTIKAVKRAVGTRYIISPFTL